MSTSRLQKFYSIALGFAMVFGAYTYLGEMAQPAQAQTCSANETSGNLSGYLETDNLGYIYLSSQTWNEDPLGEGHGTTAENFSVTYDRIDKRFNGRGWSPYAGWVDFGQINPEHSANNIAEFEDMETNPGRWGNVTPFIDVSNVVYQTDPGGFVGSAYHGEYTYFISEDDDDRSGAGYISFENVSLIDPQCPQYVNLVLNGQTDIQRNSCPISGTININWAGENVTDCRATSTNWSGPSLGNLPSPSYQTGNAYTYSGTINNNNPTDIVTISCTGENGQIVTDSANIRCGAPDDPASNCDPDTEFCGGGNVIPTYIEV